MGYIPWHSKAEYRSRNGLDNDAGQYLEGLVVHGRYENCKSLAVLSSLAARLSRSQKLCGMCGG
jgi:hypothetical protein